MSLAFTSTLIRSAISGPQPKRPSVVIKITMNTFKESGTASCSSTNRLETTRSINISEVLPLWM